MNTENTNINQTDTQNISSNASHETSPPEIKLPTPEEMGIVQVETQKQDENDQNQDKSDKTEENLPVSEVKEEKREFSEIEKKALEQGWVPKDQFKGNIDDWRNAREFVDRGELLDKLSSYHREVKGLRKSNDQMAELIQRMSSQLDEKEQSDLITYRNQAIEAGNVELVNKIDEKIATIRQNQQTAQKQQSLDPAYYQFQEDNSEWLNVSTAENKMMRDYAISTENWLMQQYPSLTTEERLQQVKEAIKKAYPHRFKPKNQPQQDYRPTFSTVESSKPPPVKSKEPSYNDLPEEAKTMVRNFCRYNTTVTKDQYAKELFRNGYIK